LNGFRLANDDLGKEVALPKVILIDDDDTHRLEFSNYVVVNGIPIESFNNLELALEFIQSSRDALVVVSELSVGNHHLFNFMSLMLRRQDCAILVLSQQGEETDKIVALELGADDFIMKTTERREILARIRASVRRLMTLPHVTRHPSNRPSAVQAGATPGSWQFQREKRELVDPYGYPVHLTSAEFSLLDALVDNIGRPLSRDYLSLVALGRHYNTSDRSIDNLIAKLRRKLRDPPKSARTIKTARSVGYVFTGFREREKITGDDTPPAVQSNF
jgi:two-component system, OmpR family, response regulator